MNAQNLNVFYLMEYTKHDKSSVGFVSLSDVYALSEHEDSLAIPDLSEYGEEKAMDYESFTLTPNYRQRFLNRTNIFESEKVFLYSFSKNKLISFKVSDLNVVAYLNIYGANWPYSQYDYMIGFEIDKKHLVDYEHGLATTLVSVAKESPFILNQVQPIKWKKNEIKSNTNDRLKTTIENLLSKFEFNRSFSNNTLVFGEQFIYERNEFRYFVQNILSGTEVIIPYAKYYYVINKTTKDTVCQELIFEHESASPSPLNYIEAEYVNQWTGKLFKNMPSVIFGLEYVSFGCPRIKFLETDKQDIYIQCDNRH